jgi:hypothetical protein
MKEVTPRVLMKQIGTGQVGFEMSDSSSAIINIVVTGDDWVNIPQDNLAVATLALANRSYIDLAGYSHEELTTFIQGVDFQHSRDPLQGGNSVSALVQRYDFITTRRISDSELANFTDAVAPGYLPSTVDLMEMVYGEHRTYAVNTTIPGTFVTTDTDTLGSGNPTAGARLHWTQVYVINPAGATGQTGQFFMYPTNLVCQAVTGKEKDLVYIERLRRAYTQDSGRNV